MVSDAAWPTLDAASAAVAGGWVAGAVAAVLAAQHDATPLRPPLLPPGVAPATLIRSAGLHRVVPLLAPHADALGLAGEAASRLRQRHRRLGRLGLANAADTDRVSSLLHHAGVEHLVVKGVVLLARLGVDRAMAADVDVWIRERDVGRVEELLTANGWERPSVAVRLPYADEGWRWRGYRWLRREKSFIRPGSSTVDLHWRLTDHPGELGFGFDQALACSVPVPEIGEHVRTLGDEHTLVHVAQHARRERWPELRQVVNTVRAAGRIDPDRLAALVLADGNVAQGVAVASRVAPWLARHARPGREGARIDRLAAEAWESCVALDHPRTIGAPPTRLARGREHVRRDWWALRSAPTWAVRTNAAVRMVVPLRVVVRRPAFTTRKRTP